MSGYAVAQIDEIDEISDGRCPWRPVRFHFGITSFGVNASTQGTVRTLVYKSTGRATTGYLAVTIAKGTREATYRVAVTAR